MLRTLYGKLSLVLGGLLIAIGLIYVFVSQSLTEHYRQQANQHLNRHLARNLVADRNLVSQGRLDEQALKDTFQLYMVINPSIEIYLLDLEGTILAYSADPGVVKRSRVALEPIQKFLANDEDFPLLGDDPRSHDQRKIFSVTPVPSPERPEGYLYVVLRGEMYDSIIRLHQDSLLWRLGSWTLAGSLFFALLTGLLIFGLLTHRLRRLARLMDEFRQSSFQTYRPYHGRGGKGDEVDHLGEHFDQMATRMQDMLRTLQERDALRRELLNNVSHDLRTPLTCLHGYLETLKLKGDRMTPSEQRRYLEIALGHSQRLGQLVSELFELSKLEASAVQLRPEPFSIAELVQDVAQKYQLTAEQKRVRLRARFPANPPFINADIALIERVLENLLSNAVQHTPEQGEIVLELLSQPAAVTVSVEDTGAGISPEDLPYIFDRFYLGKHRTHDRSHAGLGLAIAKGIVELHKSKLQVTSRLNSGTRFWFQLPIWHPE